MRLLSLSSTLPLLGATQGTPTTTTAISSIPSNSSIPLPYPTILSTPTTNRLFRRTPSTVPPSSLSPSPSTPTTTSTTTATTSATANASTNTYHAKFGASAVATIVFCLLLATHAVQAIMYRSGFAWVAMMGAAWEAGGYAVGAYGALRQRQGWFLVPQILFTYLAPLWVNAYAYMVLGRIINFFHPRRQILGIKAENLASIFVLLDIGSFIVQMAGSVMQTPSSSPTTSQKGQRIYIIGIAVQQAFICLFTLLATVFYCQMLHAERQLPVSRTNNDHFHYHGQEQTIPAPAPVHKRAWRRPLFTLYASLAGITTRILYRLGSYASRKISPSSSNPVTNGKNIWPGYVFDALPIAIALLVWNIYHPGRYIRGPDARLPPSWLASHLFCCCYCCCCCRRHRHYRRQRSSDSDGNSNYRADNYLLMK